MTLNDLLGRKKKNARFNIIASNNLSDRTRPQNTRPRNKTLILHVIILIILYIYTILKLRYLFIFFLTFSFKRPLLVTRRINPIYNIDNIFELFFLPPIKKRKLLC